MYYFWFVKRYYRANAALQPKGLDDDRTTTQPATVEPLPSTKPRSCGGET